MKSSLFILIIFWLSAGPVQGQDLGFIETFPSATENTDTWAESWHKLVPHPSGQGFRISFNGVCLDEDGNIYLPGQAEWISKWPDGYFLTYKFNSAGQEIWNDPILYRTAPVQYAYGCDYKDGILYIAGEVASYFSSPIYDDALIYAMDAEKQDSLWTWTWDGNNNWDCITAIEVRDDGIYAVGRTDDSISSADILLTKLDFEGNIIWINQWGSSNLDVPVGDIVVGDSCIFITGVYSQNPDNFTSQAFLASFSQKTGDYKWHKLWGESVSATGSDIVSDSAYIYQCVNTTLSGDGTTYINKYDFKGNLQWSTVSDFHTRHLEFSEDNSLYLLSKVDDNFYIVRCNPLNGETVDYKILGFDESHLNGFKILNNDIYLTGSCLISPTSGNALIVKAPVFSTATDVYEKNLYDISIYPNPVTNELQIENHTGKNLSLKIINIMGRTIIERQLNDPKAAIHLNAPSGVYSVVITSDMGKRILEQKIVKR